MVALIDSSRRGGVIKMLYGKKGFTLIELLVVMAIIGILVGILLPTLLTIRGIAYLANCKTNLREVGLATAAYQSNFGGERLYPWDGTNTGANWFKIFTANAQGSPTTLSGANTVSLTNPEILVCPGSAHAVPSGTQGSPSYAGRTAVLSTKTAAGEPVACDKNVTPQNHDGKFNCLYLPTQVKTNPGASPIYPVNVGD